MNWAYLGIVCVVTCISPMFAQAQAQPQIKTRVSSVTIEIEVNGKQTKSAGTLYKVNILSDALSLAAHVSEQGAISPEFSCSKNDQLFAKPNNVIAITDEKPKICAENMTFNYKIPGLSWVSNDFNKATVLVQQGKFGQANSVFFEISTDAANKGEFVAARAADAGFVATTAKIIGGDQWAKYLTYDPRQNYKLILSPIGINKIKTIQKSENIPITGILDLDTKEALLKQKGAIGTSERSDHSFDLDNFVLQNPAK
jgi:hypothetical protein